MSDLALLQRELAEALRAEAPTPALAERVASGSERLTPDMQLGIYREQFFLRHVDVLREDFRSLENFLGEAPFEALAKAYLQAFPPISFTLRDLGRDLARFVAETTPWADDPLVGDLARIEWAFVEAFDAADVPALDLAVVGSMPEDAWPRAHIVLEPSVQLVALGHAAHDYRLAVRKAAASLERPEARACWVVVFRGPELLQCVDVDAAAFALLEALSGGVPLGEACERASASGFAAATVSEEKLGAWFQQWTALGWICRIE